MLQCNNIPRERHARILLLQPPTRRNLYWNLLKKGGGGGKEDQTLPDTINDRNSAVLMRNAQKTPHELDLTNEEIS